MCAMTYDVKSLLGHDALLFSHVKLSRWDDEFVYIQYVSNAMQSKITRCTPKCINQHNTTKQKVLHQYHNFCQYVLDCTFLNCNTSIWLVKN